MSEPKSPDVPWPTVTLPPAPTFSVTSATKNDDKGGEGQAMKTELHGHLAEYGDCVVVVRNEHANEYILAVSIPCDLVTQDTLQLIRPGTRCRLVLEPEANDERQNAG